MPPSTDTATGETLRSQPLIKPVTAYLPLVLTVLIGLGFALYRFGLHVLDPSNIAWFQGDSTWHFLVWHFFRREPWGIPPGQVDGFLAPLGTSVGSADALPLLALPLKLFSAALPPDFQYLGTWLFICYALQGIFGYLLARTFCRNRWLASVAGLFFLFSPVMIFRAGHIALSAHWILLFALWHYLASAGALRLRRSYARLWLLIVALVGLIHPYLVAMVFPIAFVSLLREWTRKKLKLVPALGLLLGMGAVVALEWWVSGLLGSGQNLEMWGFDHFSMNLNALVNPLTRSRLLPPLPLGDGQYEGFMYLGLGVIGLGVVATVLLSGSGGRVVRRAPGRLYASGHLPLALLALGFALYALGETVMIGNVELFDLPLFTNFRTLTSTFRAPGRFFWPTLYLLYVVILAYLVRTLPPRTAALTLAVGLLVQVGDLKLNFPFADTQRTFSENLQDSRWEQVIAPFRTVAVIPAFERTTANRGDYADFAYLAGGQAKHLTTGAAARPPIDLDVVKKQLEEEAVSGPRRPNTLYVFSAVRFAQFYLTKLEPGLRCYELGDYVACHSAERKLNLGSAVDLSSYLPPAYERVSLTDFLERYDDRTVVLVSEGGVGTTLGNADAVLAQKGSRGRLAPEEAYTAVIHHGRVIFEANGDSAGSDADDDLANSNSGGDNSDDNDSGSDSVEQQWDGNAVLGKGANQLVLPKNVHISGSASAEDNAYIVLDGTPAFKTERGLNVVVLDREFEVVAAANFDTQVTDKGVVKR